LTEDIKKEEVKEEEATETTEEVVEVSPFEESDKN